MAKSCLDITLPSFIRMRHTGQSTANLAVSDFQREPVRRSRDHSKLRGYRPYRTFIHVKLSNEEINSLKGADVATENIAIVVEERVALEPVKKKQGFINNAMKAHAKHHSRVVARLGPWCIRNELFTYSKLACTARPDKKSLGAHWPIDNNYYKYIFHGYPLQMTRGRGFKFVASCLHAFGSENILLACHSKNNFARSRKH